MNLNPKEAAQQLLESTWKGRGFPVDPILIAGDLGIDVIETDLPDNVSGALIKDEGKDPVIVLSKTDSKNRQRFTCAHELGHYAYRITSNENHYEYVDLRSDSSANGTNKEEIFANQFAASLLMPKEAIEELVNKKLPDFLLAQRFGVSDDAVRFRLKNLNLK